MTTWSDYQEHVKAVDADAGRDLEEAQGVADIVTAMIRQRNSLGLTQRELAGLCGIPQSSVARIESYKTTPNLDTILKIFGQLGLKLTVTAANQA